MGAALGAVKVNLCTVKSGGDGGMSLTFEQLANIDPFLNMSRASTVS